MHISMKKRKAISGFQIGELFTGAIIAVFVGLLVAVALTPGIATGINSLTSGATPIVTGTPATLFGDVILFLALGVMLFVVAFALLFLRSRGKLAFDYAGTVAPGNLQYSSVNDATYSEITNTYELTSYN